ncbi:chondroitinase family polysaccharide lyase [Vibrio hangzhouensis]|uniref:Chondroitin sulfate ABC lyase n=1 Tax=Vibrio hangzhouensis TaxID=462991 RepID=A0A1H6B7K4_9VIBR|nr:chondroitinase family polysaccharide lyase [Vibrio hangzhouensis]SEG56833.1 chondroitin-sulfate-ABC endolyase/exolyase [Vibrio hangzhouensis]
MKTNVSLLKITPIAAMISSLLFCGVAVAQTTEVDKNESEVQQVVVEHNPLEAQIIGFVDDTMPDYVTVTEGSHIELTKKRSIYGDQSLKWDWKSGDELHIDHTFYYYTPEESFRAYGRGSSTVFSVWVYNEKASDGELKFEFGSSSSNFTMKLNFTGWRTVGLAFHRDMLGSPSSEMRGVTVTAQNSDEGGELYIDRMMVSLDDIRYQWSDDMVTTKITKPEIDYELPEVLPEPTIEELVALDRIKSELIDFHVANMGSGKRVINDIRKQYDRYNLRKEDGVIRGAHLLTKNQITIYRPEHLNDTDKVYVDEYERLRTYAELMERIARLWKVTEDAEIKQEMHDKYMLMTEHLLDQGFQKGASLVATHHWGYPTRGWYASILLMEEPMREAGLMEPVHESLMWFSREFRDRGFAMKVGPKSSDMDYYNTLLLAQMIMLLLEDDVKERVALYHKFSDFISGNLAQTPVGYADGFRPDGTAWRHRGNYPGYSFAALRFASFSAYLLRESPFELSQEAREYLKLAMMSARVYSNPNPGVGTNGRRPFFGISIERVASGFEWLAKAGVHGEGIDRELAQAYLRITEKTAEEGKRIFGVPVAPEDHPQGAYTFNYAAMGVYRYQDKMVTMKGWNRYVWSSEIYQRANRFGRYQSHGSVQIHKWGNEKDYGYFEEGWDWNRMPGATTIHLPWELLNSPREHTTMLHNESRYNGATDLKGKYGAFGFVLENPTRWPEFIDPSFTAKKSVFSFDNRLVMVGSNISNGRTAYNTDTTLFQYGLTDKTQSMYVNGEKIEAFPYSTMLSEGDWVIDGMGNGYYIVKGGDIHVQRQRQESLDNQRMQPTEGDFASAWIDHGKAPSKAKYEYIVVLDATPESMAKLAQEMSQTPSQPYRVIRQDGNAHIVHDNESGVTGYTAFGFVRTNDKWVRAISTSAVVMAQEKDNILALSVANPDLNMESDTRSRVAPVAVTLIGSWELREPMENVTIRRKGPTTVVTVNCIDGIPVQIDLNKI